MFKEMFKFFNVQSMLTISHKFDAGDVAANDTIYVSAVLSPQIRTRCATWGEVEPRIFSSVRRNEV